MLIFKAMTKNKRRDVRHAAQNKRYRCGPAMTACKRVTGAAICAPKSQSKRCGAVMARKDNKQIQCRMRHRMPNAWARGQVDTSSHEGPGKRFLGSVASKNERMSRWYAALCGTSVLGSFKSRSAVREKGRQMRRPDQESECFAPSAEPLMISLVQAAVILHRLGCGVEPLLFSSVSLSRQAKGGCRAQWHVFVNRQISSRADSSNRGDQCVLFGETASASPLFHRLATVFVNRVQLSSKWHRIRRRDPLDRAGFGAERRRL